MVIVEFFEHPDRILIRLDLEDARKLQSDLECIDDISTVSDYIWERITKILKEESA